MYKRQEVSEYIANKLKSNIRQLEGVVKKLKAYKLLVGSPTTILIARMPSGTSSMTASPSR